MALLDSIFAMPWLKSSPEYEAKEPKAKIRSLRLTQVYFLILGVTIMIFLPGTKRPTDDIIIAMIGVPIVIGVLIIMNEIAIRALK